MSHLSLCSIHECCAVCLERLCRVLCSSPACLSSLSSPLALPSLSLRHRVQAPFSKLTCSRRNQLHGRLLSGTVHLARRKKINGPDFPFKPLKGRRHGMVPAQVTRKSHALGLSYFCQESDGSVPAGALGTTHCLLN